MRGQGRPQRMQLASIMHFRRTLQDTRLAHTWESTGQRTAPVVDESVPSADARPPKLEEAMATTIKAEQVGFLEPSTVRGVGITNETLLIKPK